MTDEPASTAPHADYPMAVAAESVRKQKRRKYSHHLCPRCHKETLERKHLPAFLKPLRLLPGINPRHYVCESCSKDVILWNPPRN